jgi:aspartokinase
LPGRCVADEYGGVQVSVHHDMAILSMAGKQMWHMVDITGRMFTTL